jgi:hypothetical protein
MLPIKDLAAQLLANVNGGGAPFGKLDEAGNDTERKQDALVQLRISSNCVPTQKRALKSTHISTSQSVPRYFSSSVICCPEARE